MAVFHDTDSNVTCMKVKKYLGSDSEPFLIIMRLPTQGFLIDV